MNRIITVNRTFGSGGREFGKRLAELLGVAYYDHEIITKIAEKTGLAEEYVNSIVDRKPINYSPITIGRSFLMHTPSMPDFNADIFARQKEIILDLADKSDCVIIGRCANYILRDKEPLCFFVYADMETRMRRCREKAETNEGLNDRQLKKRIEEIDSERAAYYKYFTGEKWDDLSNYDVCLNTTRKSVKKLAEGFAEMIGKG